MLITRDFSNCPYQTEPHLAVDPNDPDHLVMGTIDYDFPSTSSYVSLDGGESWRGPFHAPYLLDDLGSGGDPVLAIDRDGATYMTMISIGEEEFTVGPSASSRRCRASRWRAPMTAARAGRRPSPPRAAG